MIQNAMRQIHYSVSINKSAKSQVSTTTDMNILVSNIGLLKALEVIRKLKEVMPIARASMHLRVVCPISYRIEMKRIIQEELGLGILNEIDPKAVNAEVIDVNANKTANFDVRIDPEMFRKLEEAIQTTTDSKNPIDN